MHILYIYKSNKNKFEGVGRGEEVMKIKIHNYVGFYKYIYNI